MDSDRQGVVVSIPRTPARQCELLPEVRVCNAPARRRGPILCVRRRFEQVVSTACGYVQDREIGRVGGQLDAAAGCRELSESVAGKAGRVAQRGNDGAGTARRNLMDASGEVSQGDGHHTVPPELPVHAGQDVASGVVASGELLSVVGAKAHGSSGLPGGADELLRGLGLRDRGGGQQGGGDGEGGSGKPGPESRRGRGGPAPLRIGRGCPLNVGSGRVGSGRVGSGRVGSGRVGSGRVGSGRVGSPSSR